MSLIQEFMTTCCFVNKTKTPDGEGGYTTNWTDGAEFDAAIVMDSSMQARRAEAEGVTAVYTVTTNKDVILEYHEVFRRKSDGLTFRITSNGADKVSPASASFSISQATAERWDLT